MAGKGKGKGGKGKPPARPAGASLGLLKSLHLLSRIPDGQLEKLAGFLETCAYRDGQVIFEEDSPGDSMFFVASGSVRIAKKLDPGQKKSALKDLALLRAGDCFGEMALIDSVPRSADALAAGETTLLRLNRESLMGWLNSNPTAAMSFFTQLVPVLAGHIRRSSSELTLIFDLSQTLLEPFASGRALLEKVLGQMLPHLEGEWTAGAYLYNVYNDEMDLSAASPGFEKLASRFTAGDRPSGNSWLDERTYQVVLPAAKTPRGHMVFSRAAPLSPKEKDDAARTLTTTGRLIASALENLGYRVEEILRERLKASSQSGQL